MTKAWKIVIICVSSLLACILCFLGVYFLWPWNKAFFDMSTKEFNIPGLDTAFVPQGFTNIDGTDKYLISGYMSDNSPSKFFVVDNDGNVEKSFTLKNKGVDYIGHAGGIALDLRYRIFYLP